MNTKNNILSLIQASLEDDKAEGIVVIPLKGKTNIADYMIIASATSKRHISTIADNLALKLKKQGITTKPEGPTDLGWVVIDAADAIVHIFRPETREYYDIEGLWGSAINK